MVTNETDIVECSYVVAYQRHCSLPINNATNVPLYTTDIPFQKPLLNVIHVVSDQNMVKICTPLGIDYFIKVTFTFSKTLPRRFATRRCLDASRQYY